MGVETNLRGPLRACVQSRSDERALCWTHKRERKWVGEKREKWEISCLCPVNQHDAVLWAQLVPHLDGRLFGCLFEATLSADCWLIQCSHRGVAVNWYLNITIITAVHVWCGTEGFVSFPICSLCLWSICFTKDLFSSLVQTWTS